MYDSRREALSKWKSKLGKAATYRALIEVFFKAGEVNSADAVCYLFKDLNISSKLRYRSIACTRKIGKTPNLSAMLEDKAQRVCVTVVSTREH